MSLVIFLLTQSLMCKIENGKIRGENVRFEHNFSNGVDLIAGKARANRKGSQIRVDTAPIAKGIDAILVERDSGARLKTGELLCIVGNELRTIFEVQLSKIDDSETEYRCNWKFTATAHAGAYDIAQHCKTTHIEVGQDEEQQRRTLQFDGEKYR